MEDNKRAADDANLERYIAHETHVKCERIPGANFYTAAEMAIDAYKAALSSRADGGKDSSDARDAERYRWLREQDDSGPLFVMYGSNGTWGECGHSDIYGELLDESIDEEIAKEAKK
jgi:hypothetical protein